MFIRRSEELAVLNNTCDWFTFLIRSPPVQSMLSQRAEFPSFREHWIVFHFLCHLSVSGCLSYFCILTIVNNAVVNMRVQYLLNILLNIYPLVPSFWESKIIKVIEVQNTILLTRGKVLKEIGSWFSRYKVSVILE